jgi:F-type H+-transporting ATPase subunit delta
MSDHRIAVRYAKPIFELAQEQKALDKVKSDMENFVMLCEQSRDFSLMLKSPIIPHLRKAEILKLIFAGKTHQLTMMAFEIITRKNRESLLHEIAKEFVTIYNKQMGYQEATVTTTFALDTSFRKSFEQIVKTVSGGNAILKEVVKPEIIGGFVLRMGDKQIDASVSTSLKEMKLKFNKKQ